MGMPNRIVFIRHGQSEANVVQHRDKRGEDVSSEKNLEIRLRQDYKQRLSALGRQQAQHTSQWIEQNIGPIPDFDTFFVSSFFRARETAAILTQNYPDILWEIDDRLSERYWGVHGPLTIEQRKENFGITGQLMKNDPFHAAFEGGESIWGVKNERIRNLMNTWAREQEGKKLLIVTHGDFIRAARVGFERILPEDFEEIENNPIYKVKNCQILEYSRIDPYSGIDQGKIRWRRISNPTEPETSPDGGNWVELGGKPKMNSKDLIAKIEVLAPTILDIGFDNSFDH